MWFMGREVGRKDLSTAFPGISAQTWHSTCDHSAEKTTRTICIIFSLSILPTIRASYKNHGFALGVSQRLQKSTFPKLGGRFCGARLRKSKGKRTELTLDEKNHFCRKLWYYWHPFKFVDLHETFSFTRGSDHTAWTNMEIFEKIL